MRYFAVVCVWIVVVLFIGIGFFSLCKQTGHDFNEFGFEFGLVAGSFSLMLSKDVFNEFKK